MAAGSRESFAWPSRFFPFSLMTLGIRDIAYYLPSGVRTNEEICRTHGFDEAFVSEKLGITTRHVAAADESTADLCTGAARKLLARSGVAPDSVELLIVVTQTPDYCLPHTAALVQESLNMPKSIATFDINLGCSGYIYGLSAAIAFMEANGMTTGVLITGEEYTKIMDPGDRATAPLFGDGAAATLLSHEPLYVVGKSTFGTDGSRHDALIVLGSGTREGAREPLHMDGRIIFDFMMSEVPVDITNCLKLNGLNMEDIDAWVFHQASRYMLESLAKRAGIPQDRLVVDIEDVGNTTSSSIPIAVSRRILTMDDPLERIFLSGFGVGLSWASTVLTRLR